MGNVGSVASNLCYRNDEMQTPKADSGTPEIALHQVQAIIIAFSQRVDPRKWQKSHGGPRATGNTLLRGGGEVGVSGHVNGKRGVASNGVRVG